MNLWVIGDNFWMEIAEKNIIFHQCQKKEADSRPPNHPSNLVCIPFSGAQMSYP